MNKGYNEIVATCKLMSCTDQDGMFTEYWEDSIYVYACIWLTQNEGALPSTIKMELIK